MVIHADGGNHHRHHIRRRHHHGAGRPAAPGSRILKKAMQEGYSTARPEVRSLGFGAGMGLPNMKRFTDEMKIDTVIGQERPSP